MSENSFWRKGFIYLVIALIFAYPAIKFCFKGFAEISAARKSEQWIELKAELKSYAVKPVIERGERSGQYLTATYTYHFKNEKFIGNAVAIDPTFGGSVDKIVTAKSILEKSTKEQQKVAAFVDPQKPENSILFKVTPVNGFIFVAVGLAFLFISLILFLVFLKSFLQNNKRDELQKLYPRQPWKWEPKWHSFKMSGEPAWKKVLPILVVSIIFWVVSTIILIGVAFLPKLGVAEYAGLLTLILIDLVFLFHCRRKIKGERWADKLYLITSSYPVVPGENFKFRIVAEKVKDKQIVNGCKIFFKLNRGKGFGEVLSTEEDLEDTLYVDDSVCFCLNPDVEVNGDTMVFDLELQLPEKSPETSLGVEFENRWQLLFYFSNDNKEYIETFELPVYSEDSFDKSEVNKTY